MDYTIDIATAEDVDAAANICALALGKDQYDCAKIDFGLHLTDTPYPPVNLVAKLKDGTVVGTIQSVISYIAPKVRGIAWLCVHPDYQRQGLGNALLQHCENYCQEQFWNNGEGSFVLVTKNREDFYLKRGYKTIASDHSGKPLMIKKILAKK